MAVEDASYIPLTSQFSLSGIRHARGVVEAVTPGEYLFVRTNAAAARSTEARLDRSPCTACGVHPRSRDPQSGVTPVGSKQRAMLASRRRFIDRDDCDSRVEAAVRGSPGVAARLPPALRAVAVSFWVMVISFGLIRLAPGDPVLARLGAEAEPAAIERLRRALRLDVDPVTQFFEYLWGLLHGDLGKSIENGRRRHGDHRSRPCR